MTPIKITEKNAAKIDAALGAVNGRAKSLTVTSYAEVARVADHADRVLDSLPQRERIGASVGYIPAGPCAHSYKYKAKTTGVKIERRSTGWFLTDVWGDSVFPRQAERLRVVITPEQRDAIARRALAGFTVKTVQAEREATA